MTTKRQNGFTLIELSIVLIIIGLLLGGLLMPLASQMHESRVAQSLARLNEAKEALIGFALVNQRLPCPDTDGDGLEQAAPCNNSEGVLPWRSLGIGQFDAWQREIRYRGDNAFTTNTLIPDPANTTSGLSVQNRTGAPLSEVNPNAPAAILFSCGDNGLPDLGNDANGAINTDALCSNPGAPDAIYIQDDYVKDVFDDILLVLSKSVLIYKLAAAGKWP